MEEKNKKIFSTILMLVGALFIVISGGIFVSQTWHYLPQAVKKLLLVAVTAAFFGGSWYVEKRSDLKKTPALLYDLGVSFIGFSVLALLDVLAWDLSVKLTVAFLAMSVPVALHFRKKQGITDFLLQVLLADGCVLCVSAYPLQNTINVTVLCACVVNLLLAGFIYYCRETAREESKLELIAQITGWVHLALSFPGIFANAMTEKNFFFSVLPMLLMVAALTVLYLSHKCTVYRILQSVGLYFLIACVTAFCGQFLQPLFPYGYRDVEMELEIFLAFLIDLGLMICLDRREMVVLNSAFTAIISWCQVFVWMYETPGKVFFSYAICMAAALLALKLARHPEEERGAAFRMCAGWFVLGLHVMACWGFPEYAKSYGLCFWFAIVCMQVSLLVGKYPVFRDILRSVSVLAILCGLGAHKIIPTEIYSQDGGKVLADFGTEYDCILMALGIVLLGKIWYDRSRVVRRIQFIGTCLILFVLLCSNFSSPALANVLFLGIVALSILLLATRLHRKDYAIASAVTLILVVLYLTKEVWMSIAWWVYLFAAGVGLVLYAIKREKAE